MAKNTSRSGSTKASEQANRRERLRAEREAQLQREKRRRNLVIGIGAGVLALVIAFVTFFSVKAWKDKKAEEARVAASQVKPPNLTKDGKAILLGKYTEGVPTLTIYTDYQCPVCKQMEAQYGDVFKQLANSGKVNVEMRTETFLDENQNNDASLRSAVAAACADVVGAYPAYVTAVYDNQPATEGDGYTDEMLRVTIAQQAGITGANLTKFQNCYDKRATQPTVTAIASNALNVDKNNATPALRVNGKNPKGWWNTLPADAAAWEAKINEIAKS